MNYKQFNNKKMKNNCGNNSKIQGGAIKMIGVGFFASAMLIITYYKGRKDGHRKGIKDGKEEINEELQEIMKKYSNR